MKTSQYNGGPMAVQLSGTFCAPKLTFGFIDLGAQFFYLEHSLPKSQSRCLSMELKFSTEILPTH